jgi:hypothetical protein
MAIVKGLSVKSKHIKTLSYSCSLKASDAYNLYQFEFHYIFAISTLIKNIGRDKTLEFIFRILEIDNE